MPYRVYWVFDCRIISKPYQSDPGSYYFQYHTYGGNNENARLCVGLGLQDYQQLMSIL